MSDNLTKQLPLDAQRVNLHDLWEIRYWCKRFGCSRAQLVIAVHTVGPVANAVAGFLREAMARPSPTPDLKGRGLPCPELAARDARPR